MPKLERSTNDTDSNSDLHSWHESYEKQLENIKCNATEQAEIARLKYLELIYIQKYFKIPVIIISGLNSIFAVGLNSYMSQQSVSVLNCLLSFFVSVLSSIELYLEINKKIETSYKSYQEFYLLSVNINNVLRVERQFRTENDGSSYLQECINSYEQLFQANTINEVRFDDKLIGL